jgi:polysaccharide export outer membrane protein
MFFRPICFVLATIVPSAALLSASPVHDANQAVGDATGKASVSQIDYVLQPFDLIQVVIFQEPDLQREVRLSEDSKVTLPLVGIVDLKGENIGEAQKKIHELYDRDYLVDPQINITVEEYAKETVNVLGSVNAPGAILIPPDQPLNLIDAITRCGGFSRLADRKHVKLTRINADGRTSTVIVNADEIIQSESSDRWRLKKGDVIFVPERII